MSDYADTSFLVSLHLAIDVNHTRAVRLARSWTTPPHLPLTDYGTYEATNALMQLVARRQLSLTEASALVREIAGGQTTGIFRHAALDHPAWLRRAHELAVTITPIANVRALDLLHVAAAQLLGRTRLLTFDVNQRRARRRIERAGIVKRAGPTPASLIEPDFLQQRLELRIGPQSIVDRIDLQPTAPNIKRVKDNESGELLGVPLGND